MVSLIQEIENEPSGTFPSETKLAELLLPLIEARRSQPSDDLISHLLEAEAEAEKLSTRDILATCILMLVAGHETTTRMIGNAMYCFTVRPGVMAALRENPALIPGALEEVLRYRPPLCGTLRTATSDVLIGTPPTKAGQALLVQISSAHHDETVLPTRRSSISSENPIAISASGREFTSAWALRLHGWRARSRSSPCCNASRICAGPAKCRYV